MKSIALRLIIGSVLSLSLIAPATAQSVRLRGTVQALEGRMLSVNADGKLVKVQLAENYTVVLGTPVELSAVAPGDFVGVGAMKAPDGKLVALRVLVFPVALRGNNEGHRGWDAVPQGTMTNATVEASVAAAQGRELLLNYKDGKQSVNVPPGTAVFTYTPAERSLLIPGAKVSIVAVTGADGTLSTPRVLVAQEGMEPPL